jgi:DNA replication protein DnaC
VDAEWAQREERKVRSLATCAWIAQHRNLLLIRPIGIGKSWLGKALAERASAVITSQVSVRGSHDLIGQPAHADAIRDRPIHTAHIICCCW